jgi:hypothetical protein
MQVACALTVRQCESLLAHLEQDVEGFAGAAALDLTTGRRLATHCVQPAFDMGTAVRTALVTVRMHQAIADNALEEIAVADARCYHVYQLLDPTVLLVVSARRAATSMAMLRAVIRHHALPLAEQNYALRVMQEMG